MIEITPENFRKNISRAKKKLCNFLKENCGLINPLSSCRCKNKAQVLIEKGLIDPQKLVFTKKSLNYLEELSKRKAEKFSRWFSSKCHQFFSVNYLHESPDYSSIFKDMVNSSELNDLMDLQI